MTAFRLQLALATCLGVLPVSVAESQTSDSGLPPVTISRRTTFVTLPKQSNGFVDLAGAIDLHYSRGVTPETNAATLLFEALGPQPVNTPLPAEFFNRLGMSMPSADGEYFLSFNDFLAARGIAEGSGQYVQLKEQRSMAARAVWFESRCPELADWLEANDRPLASISRAATRPKYFVPILRPKEAARLERAQGLMAAELPHVQALGDIAFSLAARATLRVNEGDLPGAWSDVMTLLRLARLIGQGPTFVEVLVGQAISQLAQRAAQVYIDSGDLSGEVARRGLEDLASLPPTTGMMDKVHIFERMMFVDAVLLMQDRDDEAGRILAEMSTAEGRDGLKILRQSLETARHPSIDWNAALVAGHAWYDRGVDALHKPTYREQKAATGEFHRSLKTSLAKITETGRRQLRRGLKWSPANDKSWGEILAGVMMSDLSLLPRAQGLIEQRARNLRLALAVIAFADAEGSFPEKLEQLTPEYLDRIPEDYFSHAPLKYREKLVGRVVYSVGPNIQDEGGVHTDASGADDEGVAIPY